MVSRFKNELIVLWVEFEELQLSASLLASCTIAAAFSNFLCVSRIRSLRGGREGGGTYLHVGVSGVRVTFILLSLCPAGVDFKVKTITVGSNRVKMSIWVSMAFCNPCTGLLLHPCRPISVYQYLCKILIV